MLHKCANPNCSTPFLRLTEGKLFVIQGPFRTFRAHASRTKPVLRQIEHYWLCDSCSRQFTLIYEPGLGAQTVPLPQVIIRKAPHSVIDDHAAGNANVGS